MEATAENPRGVTLARCVSSRRKAMRATVELRPLSTVAYSSRVFACFFLTLAVATSSDVRVLEMAGNADAFVKCLDRTSSSETARVLPCVEQAGLMEQHIISPQREPFETMSVGSVSEQDIQLVKSFEITEEEEEEEAEMGVGVAMTLVVGVSFIMCITYLVNSKDEDIRKYIWMILCGTVSIFCAILIFRGVDAVIDHAIAGTSKGVHLWVSQAHMFVWSMLLHIVLAYFPGKKGLGLILAHITGYSAIKAWGGVQQYSYFRHSFPMALLVVPVALGGITIMIRLSNVIIELTAPNGQLPKHNSPDAKESEQEAEHDVIAFGCSFLTSVAFMLLITGRMPNVLGEEKEVDLFAHTYTECFLLFLIGSGSLALATAIFFEKHSTHEGEEGADGGVGVGARGSQGIAPGSGEVREHQPAESTSARADLDTVNEVSDEGENALAAPTLNRVKELAVTYLSYTFAFCSFFSAYWFCATVKATKDEACLALGMALFVSLAVFATIFVLDAIDDALKGDGAENSRIHKVIVHIVMALAILIGSVWERCFDVSVKILAAKAENPALAQLALAICCAVLLFPAWRYYMLPMILHDGYKFNIIIKANWDITKLNEAIIFLEEAHRQKVEHEEAKALDATFVDSTEEED
eukprot:TRINITY_DN64160_c0_g1_i1.p1 TRINITY_DN64160_c0_g1~~TRINITY_DN64160_c0_g1_i1.p1  ORF type:complete len:640 (+),score=82.16 TRINITY_DN64160_c0_g1_i1:116-2035(+)